ncbi:GNAT family N-acetyltransferase, partial [bacterium]|nr:GNAT family N-acetyltransferase [bacterium]
STLTLGQPISSFAQLLGIEDTWRTLYQSLEVKSIFLSFDYILSWYRCFAGSNQVRVYPLLEGDEVVGYWPLLLKKKGLFRVLSSLVNDHCLEAHPLVRDGYEEAFAQSGRHVLTRDKRSGDLLRYFEGYSFQPYALAKKLAVGRLHARTFAEPTFSIALPDSFEEYVSKHLSAKMRKNMKQMLNKIARVEDHVFRHETGDQAVGAWPLFLEIEDSGWKGEQGTSIRRLSPRFQDFYADLIRLLAQSGQLHLYFLQIADQPVSGAFCYVDRGIFYYNKIGYRESYASLSPSNLLLFHIIEDVIREMPSVERFHLFPWDGGYKHRYINEASCYYEKIIYNDTILGLTAYALSSIKERAKRVHGIASTVGWIRKRL